MLSKMLFSGAAGAVELYSAQAVKEIHRALFSRLPSGDLQTEQGAPIEPGALRDQEVSVGRHVAPVSASLGMFLDRWATFFGGVRRGDAHRSKNIPKLTDTGAT